MIRTASRILSLTVLSSKQITPTFPKHNYSFSNYKLPASTTDISNMIGYLNTSDQPTLTIMQKLSHFSFSSMYHGLDQFSRELLFTLANDYNLGLPAAVILISFILRLSFFYPNVKGQIAALKMKQIKPHLQRFKQQSKIAQMTRNLALMKSAKQQFKQVQKKKGIDNFYNFINILQIPFLITWFLSLRYVTALPEVFPSATQSFLWIPDLSVYDPYFILPVTSALLTSYAISISPGMKNANIMPLMEPFIKYIKFLPLLSLPITGFFPALINLYWCVLAVNQAILSLAMNTNYVKNLVIHQDIQVKPQIIKAVFVEEKLKPKQKQNTDVKFTENTKIQKQSQNVPPSVQKLQILLKKPKKIKKQPVK